MFRNDRNDRNKHFIQREILFYLEYIRSRPNWVQRGTTLEGQHVKHATNTCPAKGSTLQHVVPPALMVNDLIKNEILLRVQESI